MDDNIIYYLVLGAIYLISRFFKKKKPVKPVTPRQQQKEDERYYESESQAAPVPRSQPQKPSSFEDLLKEISQEFSDRREPAPQEVIVEEPAESITPVPEESEKTREQLYVEKRQREAAELARQEELIRLAEEAEEHEPHAVMELLQEEGGAANAVVLSEILNKKY